MPPPSWRAYKRGACWPTRASRRSTRPAYPVRRLPVQAHVDVGIAAQRRPHLGPKKTEATREPADNSRGGSRLLSRTSVSQASATSPRATFPRGRPSMVCDEGRGVGEWAGRVSRFRRRHQAARRGTIGERYGNLFEMYEITIRRENPYQVPMRIYPAAHYAMGGLWVDYNLMSNIPGLLVIGEGEFFRSRREHPLGPSALTQAVGYLFFLFPFRHYYTSHPPKSPQPPPFLLFLPKQNVRNRVKKLISLKGKRTLISFHRELRQDHVGPVRDGTQRGQSERGVEQGYRRCANSLGKIDRHGQRRGFNVALERRTDCRFLEVR